MCSGLQDRDVELLANGPAGAYLRTLKEIYVNFKGVFISNKVVLS